MKVELMEREACDPSFENPSLPPCILSSNPDGAADAYYHAQRRQTGEEFRSAAPPDCRIEYVCDGPPGGAQPDQVPVQQVPAQADQVPVQQVPVQEVRVQEVPVQEVPVQQVPAQPDQVQQVPSEPVDVLGSESVLHYSSPPQIVPSGEYFKAE